MFYEWFFSQPADKKSIEAEEKKTTPEQLRKRAKELAEADASWRTKFECLGFENARKLAGFTPTEIADIKQQLKEDRKLLLQDPVYLRKRLYELKGIDSSWTAYFFGSSSARRNAGFEWDEIRAIEKQQAKDLAVQKAKQVTSIIGSFFSSAEQKETKPINREKTDAIIKKQAERKERLGL